MGYHLFLYFLMSHAACILGWDAIVSTGWMSGWKDGWICILEVVDGLHRTDRGGKLRSSWLVL